MSLSPRIIELDEQIKANQEKPKVKTQKDVSNIAQIFTLGVASNRQTPLLINPEEMSQQDLINLQMNRSAYLSFQASMLNNRKKIVGNESRDQKERQKFIEKLFSQTEEMDPVMIPVKA